MITPWSDGLLSKVDSLYTMGWADEGWPAVLERWQRAVAAGGEPGGLPIIQPPATDDDVRALEARIGKPLPPSYRSFLLTSNGLFIAGYRPESEPIDALLPAARVVSLRRPYPLWLSLHPGESLSSLFDLDGKVAAQLLDPDEYSCRGHLLYSIKIDGGPPESDLFLDPLDIDADGEWRAWDQYKETCPKYRSFGDLIEDMVRRLELPKPPAYYRHLIDPSPEAEERLSLESQLDAGGATTDRAVLRLVELATADESAQARAPAVRVLQRSEMPAAREAMLRMIEARPDDPVVVHNALQGGIGRQRSDGLRMALSRALAGPHGASYASDLIWQWPELIEEAWRTTRDPAWLRHLLFARRPGALEATIVALADPDLSAETRNWLCYTLSHSAGERPSDPTQPEAVRRLAEIPANNRQNLAQALLGWGQIDIAMSLLGENLEEPNANGPYLFMKLNELAPIGAAPVLIASLHRKPTANVLQSLSFIDHPDTAPELARHLDGALREQALLALEQHGTPQALDILARRASIGDVDAARALARCRDERAMQPLVDQVGGPHHRSAVSGLRDLRHSSSEPLLVRIAAEDANDNVAVIATHGLVMARSEHARTAAQALLGRGDPDVNKLAKHWLQLLPGPDARRHTQA